jgi:iron complex transport system substrate-binding protein
MQKLVRIVRIVLLLGLVLGAGCQKSKGTRDTITDRLGNERALPARTERIIATAPSSTEIISALGGGERLVAIDSYSGGIAGVSATAVQIDFSSPDAEVIISLSPDLIIAAGTTISGSREEPFKLLQAAGIPVFYVPTSTSIEDIYKDIAFIAALLGAEEKGESLIQEMQEQIAEITAVASGITDRATVYFEISPAPYLYSMGKDTFIHQMLEIIGARNIFEDVSGWIAPSVEAVIERNPDVILSNVDYGDDPIGEIKSREGFAALKAVSDDRVYLIDSNASSRPSQHIVKALKQMARVVYPEYYAAYETW